MASQGPNNPASATQGSTLGGTAVWSNVTNAEAADGSFASVNLDCTISQEIVVTNFGFSIPSGATINGIVVEVLRKSDQTGVVVDNYIVLTKDGVNQVASAFNRQDPFTQWPSVASYASYGASNDLWGESWTVAQINASTFGVMVCAQENCSNVDVGYIDHIRITIYYTAAASVTGSPVMAFQSSIGSPF